eukprot:360308_1
MYIENRNKVKSKMALYLCSIILLKTVIVDSFEVCNIAFCPPDKSLECGEDSSAGAIGFATCDDDSVTATIIKNSKTEPTAGVCPQVHEINRTWDCCGNLCNQVITVVDLSPPRINPRFRPVVTVQCDSIPKLLDARCRDDCSGYAGPSIVFPILNETGENFVCLHSYDLIRKWTCTDDCGHSVSRSQTTPVQDTTPPVLSGVPIDDVVECNSIPAPAIPVCTDNCV